MSDSKVYYDQETKAAIGEFKGFLSSEDFKAIANELHEVRKKNFSNKQLNDIKEMKVINQETQTWLDSVWFPKAIQSGLKHFAFVVPDDIFGKLSMEGANKNQASASPIEIEYFNDITKAKAWLKNK